MLFVNIFIIHIEICIALTHEALICLLIGSQFTTIVSLSSDKFIQHGPTNILLSVSLFTSSSYFFYFQLL